MFGFGRKIRLRGPDGVAVCEGPMLEDFEAAERFGLMGLRKNQARVRLGKLALYYRDLGKDYYVPYDRIDRGFIRISECQPDDSPAYYYYRLILVRAEKEFANLIFNEEKEADRTLERLKELCPGMAVGYVPPEGGAKPRFM